MMDETLYRISRIFALLKLNPEGLTIQAISTRLGISKALVRIDLERLSTNGIGLSCEPPDEEDENTKWFIAVNKDHKVPTPVFTQMEALALFDFLLENNTEMHQKIREKIAVALTGKESEAVQKKLETRLICKGPKHYFSSDELAARIAMLEDLVVNGSHIKVVYQSDKGKDFEKEFDAYGLIYYWVWGFWYLYGKNKSGDERILRVDRIKSFEVTGAFDYPKDFSMDELFANAWGINRDGKLRQVKIRFIDQFNVKQKVKKDTAHRINRQINEEKVGEFIYTDLVEGISDMLPWLRSFGSSVEVLEPIELRQEMIDSAKRVYRLYQNQ